MNITEEQQLLRNDTFQIYFFLQRQLGSKRRWVPIYVTRWGCWGCWDSCGSEESVSVSERTPVQNGSQRHDSKKEKASAKVQYPVFIQVVCKDPPVSVGTQMEMLGTLGSLTSSDMINILREIVAGKQATGQSLTERHILSGPKVPWQALAKYFGSKTLERLDSRLVFIVIDNFRQKGKHRRAY
ncbi:hypothetical protein BT96DRAFT_1077001 [Gymnopus androsaceus JB14]|uniref:Uncharacterized protein n=1 Tax=Gymnopus androsaceus JB14 TaxID=1447944 RepID=A0A6A4IN40_9AGAR|nr:hypothetical protein BT96DRAFT_1077001 [Gymnopus androsaceus JB14]